MNAGPVGIRHINIKVQEISPYDNIDNISMGVIYGGSHCVQLHDGGHQPPAQQ